LYLQHNTRFLIFCKKTNTAGRCRVTICIIFAVLGPLASSRASNFGYLCGLTLEFAAGE